MRRALPLRVHRSLAALGVFALAIMSLLLSSPAVRATNPPSQLGTAQVSDNPAYFDLLTNGPSSLAHVNYLSWVRYADVLWMAGDYPQEPADLTNENATFSNLDVDPIEGQRKDV